MRPKPVPIVWYLDSSEIPQDRPNVMKELREAIETFNEGDKTLTWLDDEFKRILNIS